MSEYETGPIPSAPKRQFKWAAVLQQVREIPEGQALFIPGSGFSEYELSTLSSLVYSAAYQRGVRIRTRIDRIKDGVWVWRKPA